MKQKQKKKHPVRNGILLGLVAALAVSAGVYSHFGGFGTGECADVEEFAKYSTAVSDMTIPEHTQIVALGEATHGNAEFQELKLTIFQQLVEQNGVRAFALEGDFGGCEAVNRYIHGGDGTAKQAAAAIGFAIYRTPEMAQTIEWMRMYNETAAPGEDLRFYGFDMQRYEYSYHYLVEAAEQYGIDTTALQQIWNSEEESFSDDTTSEERTERFRAVKEQLPKEDPVAIHFADSLLQNTELGNYYTNPSTGNMLRDEFMAKNTLWILQQEQSRGNSCIFVTGHNGHVEQVGSYDKGHKVMGNRLADELGDDYFVIGTDFYKSDCNLPKMNGKRSTHTFYSYDPLAKASKRCGFEKQYLDFSVIPQSSPLKAQTVDYSWMGSLGEGYSPLMSVLPMTYRVWRSPATIYDAMIFVTNAHPTEIEPLPETLNE